MTKTKLGRMCILNVRASRRAVARYSESTAIRQAFEFDVVRNRRSMDTGLLCTVMVTFWCPPQKMDAEA
eukprot:4737272-Pyramimonas_sp.AAC.1